MSASVHEAIVNLSLLDLAKELRQRGRGEEADYYLTVVPMMLRHRGVALEDAYKMTLEDVEWELTKPIAPDGWDTTLWGKSLVCRP